MKNNLGGLKTALFSKPPDVHALPKLWRSFELDVIAIEMEEDQLA